MDQTNQTSNTSKMQNKKEQTIKIPNFDPSILPEGLVISTMTITGHFETEYKIDNIAKYLQLKRNGIVSVKYGTIYRYIWPAIDKKKKKKKKKSASFYNQATIVVQIDDKKTINVKLFKNGSIQMTGNRSVSDCNLAIDRLCNDLRAIRGVYDYKTKKINPILFVSNPEDMYPSNVIDMKIRMINSNINIGFNIDRERFYKILHSQRVNCDYDPEKHASVDIKYNYEDRKNISVFVFEKGCIMITGANNCKQILESYKYIIDKIYHNYTEIQNMSNIFNKNEIMSYFDDKGNFDKNAIMISI